MWQGHHRPFEENGCSGYWILGCEIFLRHLPVFVLPIAVARWALSHHTWLRNHTLSLVFSLPIRRPGNIGKQVKLPFAPDVFSSNSFISCSSIGPTLPLFPPSSKCAPQNTTISHSLIPINSPEFPRILFLF